MHRFARGMSDHAKNTAEARCSSVCDKVGILAEKPSGKGSYDFSVCTPKRQSCILHPTCMADPASYTVPM